MNEFTPVFDRETWKWQHFSVSLLKSFVDCERIPYFAKIVGLKQEKTKGQKRGGDWHSQQERYLKSGQDVLADRMQPAKAHLPKPGADLLVEFGFDMKAKTPLKLADGTVNPDFRPFDYARSVVRLADRPFEGYVDILDRRDPRVARLTDLKSTKPGKDDPDKYVMTEAELLRDIQYLGYAAFVHEAPELFPDAEEIEAKWIYAFAEGPARAVPVTVRESLDAAYDRWLTVNPLAIRLRRLEEVKSEDDINPTGKHKGTCENHYGKACPFRHVCFKSPTAVLRSVIKQSAQRNNFQPATSNLTPKEQNMSLQARLAAAKNPAAPASTPAPSGLGEDVAALLKGAQGSVQTTPNGTRIVFDASGNFVGQLPPKAVEKPAAPAPTPAPTVAPAPAAPERCPYEEGGGRCTLPKGHPGSIHDMDCSPASQPSTPAQPAPAPAAPVTASPVAAAVGIIPPDAPKSDPLAKPEEKRASRRAPKPATQANMTPAPQPAPANTGTLAAAAAPAPAASVGAAGERQPITEETIAGRRIKGLELYVNCIPYRKPYKHLDDYAAAQAAEAADAMQVEDFRLGERGAVMGRGGIAGLVRASPPAPGVYVAHLGAYDGELATVVEALKPLAEVLVEGI